MVGRVTVLVDSDLESNLIADLLVNNEVDENNGVEIKINDESHVVICVYRPPASMQLKSEEFMALKDAPRGYLETHGRR